MALEYEEKKLCIENMDIEAQSVYDANKNKIEVQGNRVTVILFGLLCLAFAGLLACLIFLK